MTKPAMPGHLIAVLIILGLNAFVSPQSLIFPVLLLSGGSPMLYMTLMYAMMLGLFAWNIWMLCGLATRQAWAPRWTRITAVVMCVAGSLGVLGAFGSELLEAMGLADVGVLGVATGGYMLWALGRSNVRAWLAWGAPAA
jgi:hypothetical protein